MKPNHIIFRSALRRKEGKPFKLPWMSVVKTAAFTTLRKASFRACETEPRVLDPCRSTSVREPAT